MPRKTFVAGEILTASDVNTNLMDQSVMVFDDATARATAIPTPVEGMVTYLKDTNAVEKFDGAAFVNVDTGKVLDVKSAIFSGTQSQSLAAGANVAVTDLSITHAVATGGNKLLISASLGMTAHSEADAAVGVGVFDGATAIGVGDTAGNRVRIGAGQIISGRGDTRTVGGMSYSFIYEPPDTSARTYTANAFNIREFTATVFINSRGVDNDTTNSPRAVSSLIIQEIKA